MKLFGMFLAALCALLLSAATANAATVSTDPAHPNTVYIQAAPGETNAITAWTGLPANSTQISISDLNDFTLLDTGCRLPHPSFPNRTRITCPGFTHLVVHLGDMNDTFRLKTSDPSITAFVRGGLGVDEEWGGFGHDNLSGEIVHGRLGNDTLRASQIAYGGPGRDRCVAPVRVGCER